MNTFKFELPLKSLMKFSRTFELYCRKKEKDEKITLLPVIMKAFLMKL